MAALDQILAILMGRKVYDSTTKLWRIYDQYGTELADPGGILLRGLHGWLLSQANQQAANDADIRPGGKRRRRVVIPPGYAPTPAVRRPRDDDEVLLVVGLV